MIFEIIASASCILVLGLNYWLVQIAKEITVDIKRVLDEWRSLQKTNKLIEENLALRHELNGMKQVELLRKKTEQGG